MSHINSCTKLWNVSEIQPLWDDSIVTHVPTHVEANLGQTYVSYIGVPLSVHAASGKQDGTSSVTAMATAISPCHLGKSDPRFR